MATANMTTCSGWFGSLGALVPVTRWAVGLRESSGAKINDQRTLGGERFIQTSPKNLRSWSVAVEGEPQDVDPLRLAYDPRRQKVRYWIDAWAQAMNVLNPEQAVPAAGILTLTDGALQLPDGTWATQIVTATTGQVWPFAVASKPIPVVPGITVTASVYAVSLGSFATLEITWVDATGKTLSTVTSAATAMTMQRVIVTATPPAGAAGMTMRLLNFTTACCAQVTWTDGPVPWAASRAPRRVVIVDYDEQPAFRDDAGVVNLTANATMLEVS